MKSLERIWAMFLRYAYLHKRSVSRALEFIFWPVMELMVWGFVARYFQRIAGDGLGQGVFFLISGAIFWDLLYRSQQGITLSIIEDIWSENILNLLISPLRIPEWLLATFLYGLIKTLIIASILSVLAFLFYSFNMISSFHIYLVPYVGMLLFFGWCLGMVTASLIIRWGRAVEALIWGIPFLIQPLSAIYYPIDVLPSWLIPIARAIPSTPLFEGMRDLLKTQVFNPSYIFQSFLLNCLWFVAGAGLFYFLYQRARKTGRLARLGMD